MSPLSRSLISDPDNNLSVCLSLRYFYGPVGPPTRCGRYAYITHIQYPFSHKDRYKGIAESRSQEPNSSQDLTVNMNERSSIPRGCCSSVPACRLLLLCHPIPNETLLRHVPAIISHCARIWHAPNERRHSRIRIKRWLLRLQWIFRGLPDTVTRIHPSIHPDELRPRRFLLCITSVRACD